jgi:hypothetical protein
MIYINVKYVNNMKHVWNYKSNAYVVYYFPNENNLSSINKQNNCNLLKFIVTLYIITIIAFVE